ncbi:hypothetical protein D3C72_1294830 [compost metagenome]
MVAEQYVLVGRDVVQAIVVDHRRGGPGRIDLHHLVGDEQAVEAVGDQVQRHRRHHDPQRIDVLTASKCHRTQAERAEQGEGRPAYFGKTFHEVLSPGKTGKESRVPLAGSMCTGPFSGSTLVVHGCGRWRCSLAAPNAGGAGVRT